LKPRPERIDGDAKEASRTRNIHEDWLDPLFRRETLQYAIGHGVG
jgi:hypothetical protein